MINNIADCSNWIEKEHFKFKNSDTVDFLDTRFYKILEISFDEEFPRREAFENIISTIDNPEINFVYILCGEKDGVAIYMGIVKNYNNENNLEVEDYGSALRDSIAGNYLGTRVEKIEKNRFDKLLDKIKTYDKRSVITGIPSAVEDDIRTGKNFQGIDRLINSMLGEEWLMMIICEAVDQNTIEDYLEDIYECYNRILPETKFSVNEAENKSSSEGESKSEGTNTSKSKGTGTSSGSSSDSKSTSQNITEGSSDSTSTSTSTSIGKSNSKSWDIMNKRNAQVLKYIDDELLERVYYGKSKGFYKSTTFALAKNNRVLYKIEKSIQSIFQGDSSSFSPLISRRIEISDKNSNEIITKHLSHFQSYEILAENDFLYPTLFCNPYDKSHNKLGVSTFLTSKEISIIAGIPQKEVPGLKLKTGVDFGLNITSHGETSIDLGYILQRGIPLKRNTVHLDRLNITKHTFICGVTGSGKTTTAQKILLESNLTFLIIEPAKTEYRTLIDNKKDILYFTPGREDLVPFRLNPFELLAGEKLTPHVDMLIATFNASFPMEASMPYILKEAIYKTYEKFGWDFESSTNIYHDDEKTDNSDGILWPTIKDLISEIEKTIKRKGFSERLEGEYIGTFNSRLTDLTIGTRGKIFNSRMSVDFENLLDRNVVIEMDDLKDVSDKTLLMGFILSRMNEALKIRHRKKPDFKHITLIEEAHRLLSKTSYSDTGAKQLAVGTFTDMLAEVRKYGEGLIIVDQIPNKLAPEVLKNTNTKIIHKTFASDDKESIGDTIGLDKKQKDFLSNLETGQAIIYSEGWNKPVFVKIEKGTSTESVIDEKRIKEIGYKYILDSKQIYFNYCYEDELDETQVSELLLNLNLKLKKLIFPYLEKLSDVIDKEGEEKFFMEFKNNLNIFSSYFKISEKKIPSILSNLVIERLGILCFFEGNTISDLGIKKEKIHKHFTDTFKIILVNKNPKKALKELRGEYNQAEEYDWYIPLKELN
jgi:DNA helicase HerA-like ATPase